MAQTPPKGPEFELPWILLGGATSGTTLIKKIRYLQWYRVERAPDAGIRVWAHTPFDTLDDDLPPLPTEELIDRFKIVLWQFYKKGTTTLADWEKAAPPPKSEPGWWLQVALPERIIAQVVDGQEDRFLVHYYSVGPDTENCRLGSYFILDSEGTRPLLPGSFDRNPASDDGIEERFGLKRNSPEWDRWVKARTSFKTVHRTTIVLRQRASAAEYIGVDVTAELHDYPRGRLVGGLPFGAEDVFLAICRFGPGKVTQWREALARHRALFTSWNLVCDRGSGLSRVFIEGSPGAGKERWSEAIRKASASHRKGNHTALTATLPIKALKDLLYGERNGLFERKGA